MAQIIKHRRGTLAELNGITLNNGELGIVTSSVASIGDAVLKTAVVIGNSDGTNRLSIGRIITGNATPNLSGITGGSAFNNMLYHETDAKTLLVLNTGGNTNLDLTGNIADRTIGGTLTTTGALSNASTVGASHLTGSFTGSFVGDGSNLTGVAQDIDSLGALGSATLHQTQDFFHFSDNGTEKKVTFSNLEDSIFANVSGDILVAAGGAATIQANSVALSTDTTGNYVATVTGGTGIDSDGATTGEGIAHSLTLDLNELGAETSIAQADFVAMVDATDDGSQKITFSNFEDEIFGNISGDATVAAGGALTIAATSVENSMLADDAVNSDELASGAVDDDHLSDGVATGLAGTGMTATSGVLNVIGGTGITANANEITTTDGDIVHDNLSGFVANEHIDHSGVTLTAGAGLSGGGTIAASRTFAIDISEFSDVQIASGDKFLVLDSNGSTEQLESVDDVATLFAGDGLQASSAVMAVDVSDFAGTGLEDDSSENLRLATQGTGISGGNGSTLSITPAQTAITSVYNTSLKVGRAASQEYVDFSTDNEVNTKVNNTERLSVTSAGVDVTGTLTVSSNATIEGNFTVNGETTFISSSTLDIGDNIIVLNSVSGSTNAGIQVIDRVGTAHTGSLLWNAANDYWTSGISGSTHYRHPVQAAAGDLSDNRVVLAQGNGRIESSANITDNGTTVDFNDVDLTSLDKLEGVDTNTYIDLGGSTLIVTKGTLQPSAHNGNDLGATGTRYKDLWLQGNADLEGDIDVNGTANLDNTDIDGTLDVQGVADFQARVDAQASLQVTGSVYVSAGASVAAVSASLISFRNDSNTQLGYLASADTQVVTTGLIGYNTSNGNLTISSVIDGGSF